MLIEVLLRTRLSVEFPGKWHLSDTAEPHRPSSRHVSAVSCSQMTSTLGALMLQLSRLMDRSPPQPFAVNAGCACAVAGLSELDTCCMDQLSS